MRWNTALFPRFSKDIRSIYYGITRFSPPFLVKLPQISCGSLYFKRIQFQIKYLLNSINTTLQQFTFITGHN